MLKKIISGGQTGADQAALDAAIKLGIPHGGWIPRGRKTENGLLSKKYNLKETPTSNYTERTEQNVIDSDGTLILSHGRLTGGSDYTKKMALKNGKPYLHMDMTQNIAFDSANKINRWILRESIELLNVAGSRASKDPKIYEVTFNIIETVYYLNLMGQRPRDNALKNMGNNIIDDPPASVDEAVENLIPKLKLKDKTTIANLTEAELWPLNDTLGRYIRENFDLQNKDNQLMKKIFEESESVFLEADDMSAMIIKALWERLRKTHKLRLIK